MRRVGGEVADDVVAETFLVAFERRRAYDVRREDARPWLYGIATNLIAIGSLTAVPDETTAPAGTASASPGSIPGPGT